MCFFLVGILSEVCHVFFSFHLEVNQLFPHAPQNMIKLKFSFLLTWYILLFETFIQVQTKKMILLISKRGPFFSFAFRFGHLARLDQNLDKDDYVKVWFSSEMMVHLTIWTTRSLIEIQIRRWHIPFLGSNFSKYDFKIALRLISSKESFNMQVYVRKMLSIGELRP